MGKSMQTVHFLRGESVTLQKNHIRTLASAVGFVTESDLGLTGFVAEERMPNGRVFAHVMNGDGSLTHFMAATPSRPKRRRGKNRNGRIRVLRAADSPC